MTRLRLLPIVMFAVSALLCLKLLGLVAGLGSFALGPNAAVAQSGPGSMLGPPLDLAAEAEALRRRQEAEEAAARKAAGIEDPPADMSDQPLDPAMAADPAAPVQPPAAVGAAPPPPTKATEKADENGLTTVRPAEYRPPEHSSETEVLESLSERRQDLDKREEDLAMRAKLLGAAEARLQARIEELKGLEAQLGGITEEREKAEEEKLKGLVTMYEAMKPKAAARVFDGLEMQVLLAVSRAMNPRKMSAVMAAMDPAKAALLTTALAGSQNPREVVVRREGPNFGGGPVPVSPEDLPKIMPAPPPG